MYLRRDTLAELLKQNAELTLAQALEELRAPLGTIDATINPEDWFIIGQRLCHGGIVIAAGGAGTRSQGGLRCANINPQNLGIVYFESVIISSGVALNVEMRANFLEVTSVQGFVRDARWGTLAGSRSIHGNMVGQNVGAVSGTSLGGTFSRVPANESRLTPVSAIISPGQNLVFNPGTDNLGIELWMVWREFDLRQR